MSSVVSNSFALREYLDFDEHDVNTAKRSDVMIGQET
jgi:hypothetical protein